MQQTNSAADILRCIFAGSLRVNDFVMTDIGDWQIYLWHLQFLGQFILKSLNSYLLFFTRMIL